jgi:hypothetical protein
VPLREPRFSSLPTAFDPETVSVMGEAYERAMRSVRQSEPDAIREFIAAHIVSQATVGERDPQKLCDQALAAASLPIDPEQPSPGHACLTDAPLSAS